jgi:signal transduction histidine kinase/CheY-like chemotaxis protein
MRRLSVLVVIGGVVLVVLTYLLFEAATPDTARHERTLAALRSLILNDAALQRDVLKARAGLLRNYDPLVRSVNNLRDAAAALGSAGEIAEGTGRQEIDLAVARVAEAVREEEELVEVFKSRNALLQNSLAYFSHASQQLSHATREPGIAVIVTLGELTNAMLRFTTDPDDDAAGEVATSLERLARLPASEELRRSSHSLVAHGRLVLATLPKVDDFVLRLQSGSMSERARGLQDLYLKAHARAAARAGIFRDLLYTAAVSLAMYVAYLFLRLRHNAQVLKERLTFEQLVAAISTQFINLPRARIDDGIKDGLARLAEHADVDCARIIITDIVGDRLGGYPYVWCRDGVGTAAAGRSEEVAGVAARWSLAGYQRHGCLHVPHVHALPDGPEKAGLAHLGIRSWLSIPMSRGGKRIGFLTLERIAAEKRWLDDDIALLRTAGEILANAIERELNELERETLETRLHQAQRMEAIGTLAGGIAHEFNNILGAILGYGEMALATVGKGSAARRHVRQIMRAGRRAQAVVDQVLTFSRRRDRQYRPMRIEPAVAEAIELLRATLPATLTLRARLEAKDAAVLADATEVQQVVMNLCTNAAHATEGRGTVEVGLDAIEISDETELSHGSLNPGSHVLLTVSDTGHGIDAATMERMFEPFFTTKAVGQGTGLGLPTVHGIITQLGGALDVQSRPGAGTTFRVYCPRTTEAVVEERQGGKAAVPRGNGETILLIDDEKPLVLLGEEMLAALGYEPVGFNGSAAALAAFRADPGRFDLVLTDQIMPEMTGTELAAALHEIRPELPIILMTGHGGRLQAHRLQAAGIREVLRKPLLSAAIAFCLARHLSAPSEVPGEARG